VEAALGASPGGPGPPPPSALPFPQGAGTGCGGLGPGVRWLWCRFPVQVTRRSAGHKAAHRTPAAPICDGAKPDIRAFGVPVVAIGTAAGTR